MRISLVVVGRVNGDVAKEAGVRIVSYHTANRTHMVFGNQFLQYKQEKNKTVSSIQNI